MCAQANSIGEMLVGRAISGLGVGIASNLVPLYVTEISPEKFRGTLGSLAQLSTALGILVGRIARYSLRSEFSSFARVHVVFEI